MIYCKNLLIIKKIRLDLINLSSILILILKYSFISIVIECWGVVLDIEFGFKSVTHLKLCPDKKVEYSGIDWQTMRMLI